MWESRCFREISKTLWKLGNPAFGFPRFPHRRHFHSSPGLLTACSLLRSAFAVHLVLFPLGRRPDSRGLPIQDSQIMFHEIDSPVSFLTRIQCL